MLPHFVALDAADSGSLAEVKYKILGAEPPRLG